MAVFLAKNILNYDDSSALKDFVVKSLECLNKKSLRGKKVLIKPNFLKPSLPHRAIITHPSLLIAIFEVLNDYGASIYLGDSPGFGSLDAVLNKAELYPSINRYGVKVADFSCTEHVKPEKSILFKDIELPKILFECDEIINLPKLKTHQMMVVTLAIKNLYGCIYGAKKIKFHLTAGESHETFATLLLDLYLTIRPTINILDGIFGMEGEGPSAGEVRNFGLIAASDDALTLDYEVVKLLHIKPEKVQVLDIALRQNLIPETTEFDSQFVLKDARPLKLPKSQATNFSLPKFLNKIVKSFLFSHPQVNRSCKGCGVCIKHCPASAIKLNDKFAKIDKSKCIRCYCCQELCEHNAISVRKGVLL